MNSRIAMWRGFRVLSVATVVSVLGCEDMLPPDDAVPSPPPAVEPVAGVCTGEPVQTRTDWQYPADLEGDFTEHERRALSKLHAEGWNGDGVAIVVRDEFRPDGGPSHGEGVLNVARHYAPNAIFIRSSRTAEGSRGPSDEYFRGHNPLVIQNNSFGAAVEPGTPDTLPVEQSSVTSRGRIEVWSAGNVERPMGAGPSEAVPTISHDVFTNILARSFDFTTLEHADTPCTHSKCRNGLLHAKSGVLVVGAVDYRADINDWTLSHTPGVSHSARAGQALNAFIVATDDSRPDRFTGTSYATPRVSGALAILKQKCPDLSPPQLSFILLKSARDLGDPGVDDVYGFGLLDIERAVEQAEDIAAMFDSYDSTIPATPSE